MPTEKPVVKRLRKVPEGAISYDAKTIIIILCLIFIYPIGIIFMWIWMKTWPLWLKLIISVPLILGIICIIFIKYLFI